MSGQRFAIQKSLKICIFNLLAEQVKKAQRKQKTHKYYKIGLKVSKISRNKHEKLYQCLFGHIYCYSNIKKKKKSKKNKRIFKVF